MSIVSFTFLIYICLVVLLYYTVPKTLQWTVLLVSSLLFFWASSKWLILVLLATVAVTFFTARAIEAVNRTGKEFLKEAGDSLTREEKRQAKERTKKQARRILTLGILLDLSALLILKYSNFFAEIANHFLKIIGKSVPGLSFLLPLGISYYTLQAISYMTDVYRGKIEADRNIFKFTLFLSFFPQMIQGPIPRYHQLAHQLYEEHRFDYQRLTYGAQLMLWGWMKKLIIADRIAIPVNEIFTNNAQYTGIMAFLGVAMYGIQIYADFSGGIDVVRGFSHILGIQLEENFRQPYFSRSIEEYWRRWHMTLGFWMRDYVFYPLSLSKPFANLGKKSRKLFGNSFGKKLPSFLAMFIVYFLVGFWHGPQWKYVAFGLWNGLFIMSGIMFSEIYEKARNAVRIDADSFTWRLFQMFRTFLICSMGRFFSRADRLQTAWHMFLSVFHRTRDLSPLLDGTLQTLGLNTANWVLLLVFIGILFLVDYLHERGVHLRDTIARQNILFRWAIYFAAIFSIMIFGIYGPEYVASDFIYGHF